MKIIAALVGDYYHKEELARASLQGALAEPIASGALQLLLVSDTEHLISVLDDKPDAVILFAENRVAPEAQPDLHWMTPDIEARIVQYVDEGGGWLAWHSGLASYPADGSYTGMLRGYFLSHPEQHKRVTYLAANGQLDKAFEFVDEHYFVHCEEENTEVFLRSSSVDGSSIAGWRHPYGAGKISCLTPAHREEGLLHPDFLRLLKAEAEWLVELQQIDHA
ncbi:ThuA domain-containing protein [Paenibacillus luteus]|uniref:ThuA domain-containing protein n=1 Tax=Paenibacillus luteus TaxID=2545753 RepID=UPI0011429A6A|nr:ThuA domain-containing protein [Paenibacillus luteus]